MIGQLTFDLLLGAEGRQEDVPQSVPVVEGALPIPGRVPASWSGARGRRGGGGAKAEKEEWTPGRVRSYLVGQGLDPAALVVGPAMLMAAPVGVRRVEWEEPYRRACFPLRFLPRWRWEPHFVTAPFDHDGLGMFRPWVALGQEPSGLRPYWLPGEFAESWILALGKPVLPACFVIGPECCCVQPCPVPAGVRQAVERASVLEEALQALRGRPVWLEMYATTAVGHVVTQPFVLRDFRVDGVVRAGLGSGGGARVRIGGDGGFGFELEGARDFRVFPGHVLIDSWVPGLGYHNSVGVWWGRV